MTAVAVIDFESEPIVKGVVAATRRPVASAVPKPWVVETWPSRTIATAPPGPGVTDLIGDERDDLLVVARGEGRSRATDRR